MPLEEPIPDLGALDLLASVDQLGSISAAAAAHRITQPAASMRLRHLERALGVGLLDRSNRGARLTAAGTATVEWAAKVLEAVRGLQAGTAALRERGTPHLRVAASLTVADYLLPGWLQTLVDGQPELSVSLQMGNTSRVAELVARKEVELGFIEGTRPPGRFRSRDLCRDRLVVVVAPDHPWVRRRTPVTAAVLARTPLVVREPGSGTREVVTETLAANGLGLLTSMELGSTAAIKAAAARGVGPTVISQLAVEAELRSGRLVSVPHTGLQLERTIRAIWPVGTTPSGPGRRLLDLATAV
ncbi:MAG TPA: LysR family transcriptional regulator [Acidimicrobiales bacterium]|nr:LysR family transcriptional regulator [Acidimicrobiales bacterium]